MIKICTLFVCYNCIDYFSLSSHILGTVWCNTDMFHLKLLIKFSCLINCWSNWLAHHWVFRIGWFYVEAKQISSLVPFRSSSLLCVDHIATFFVSTHFLARPVGPQLSWRFTTIRIFLWYLMKTCLLRIKMSPVKL